jgi:ABC-type Mn2+/Zn2+ transport system ATPase subunit
MALSSLIKLDLHIHSIASVYKEDPGIVKDSTKDNLNVLFRALSDNDIGLFSITDHNRFDKELYDAARNLIGSDEYSSVLGVLPGVEFDVRFANDQESCHVIAIFNAKDWETDAAKIQNYIEQYKLSDKSAAYSILEFEDLLRSIGLPTVLIADQQTGIAEPLGRKNSLTSATTNAESYLRYGYFEAVEYNKPKVQGILLNDLVRLELPTGTVIGSDCHDWAAYPAHDSGQKPRSPFYVQAKCLPTFEGLMLALTSPTTRICVPNSVSKDGYLKEVTIDGMRIPFCPGLNAIIGENGSGKSTLMKLIVGNARDVKETFVKKLKKDNAIDVEPVSNSRTAYIEQGELQRSFGNHNLFEDSLFTGISHSSFEAAIRAFSNALKQAVEKNIRKKNNAERLAATAIRINPELEGETYSFSVVVDDDFTSVANEYEDRLAAIKDILAKLDIELTYTEVYESDELALLQAGKEAMDSVRQAIQEKCEARKAEKQVRNLIDASIKRYISANRQLSNDVDKNKQRYRTQKTTFINAVVSAVKDASADDTILPSVQLESGDGVSTNPTRGFNFSKMAKYAKDSNLQDSLLEVLFNRNYRTLDRILTIDTEQGITTAISHVRENDWRVRWDAIVDEFIKSQEAADKYITDANDAKVGNTLGELSLTYYKYHTQNNDTWDVFLVDQPEDNISNSRINKHLIDYLNSLRYEKQIIIVTHNPLLVVNQDVDNVIALETVDGRMKATFGCLESTDNGIVLEKIADLMDGGRQSIQRRLRAYGSVNIY